jgi:arylsulfatase A-like enzyme
VGPVKRLSRVVGQGTFIGWLAGMTYGGWEIYLQKDFGYGFFRLAADRFAFATLEAALAGALLSLLLFVVLETLNRFGRRAFLSGGVLLVVLFIVLLALAAFPYRESVFPHHKFGNNALSVAIFTTLVLLAGSLLARRILEAHPSQERRQLPRCGWVPNAGWLLILVSLMSCLVIPRLPLARGATGKSIILVSIDTLRADRVGAYGCHRPLTPRFDSLAREGVVFEQATAAAPWTLPSHAALFTSLLPFTSDSRSEHRYPGPGLATLAERLKNAGYRTAAFTGGGYIFSKLGFDQGFDIYQDHNEGLEGGPEPIASAALAWIRSVRGKPFFAFVHTYAVHFPYAHSEFTDPNSPVHGKVFTIEDQEDVRLRGRVFAPEERQQIKDLYDGGVAFADRVFGGMLESLKKDGILDTSVLVILSDHGEDLWDHDEIRSPGHGHSLYQELLLVPLIIRAPGLVHPQARIRTPVSLLDVLPTLRELAGLPPSAPEQGRSLARTLLTGDEPDAVPIFSESIEYGPDRFACREKDLKVIVAPTPNVYLSQTPVAAQPLEIFDLSTDPKEKTSLRASATPLAAASMQDLWKRVTAVFTPAREPEDSDKISGELREQLRALGYIR